LVGKVNFYWCPHHGFWTAHKPEDCTVGATAKPDAAVKPAPTPPAAAPKMTFAQAAAAIVDDDGTESKV
jgi:hypothetical protein